MMKGVESMKCLEIENGRGFYLSNDGSMKPVDKMTKDDVLYLLNIATSSDETFEMDSLEDQESMNEAHKIIYRSLYSKFSELLENRTRFAEESASTYKDAIEKYRVE